jgi:hypothetical protein
MTDKETSPYDDLTRTAAFVLVFRQMLWIEQEAKRRGISKSELVREILDAAMAQQDKAA